MSEQEWRRRLDEAFADFCRRPECEGMVVHPASLCEWLDKHPEHRSAKRPKGNTDE